MAGYRNVNYIVVQRVLGNQNKGYCFKFKIRLSSIIVPNHVLIGYFNSNKLLD